MRIKIWGSTSDMGGMSIFYKKGISGWEAYDYKMRCVFIGVCWENNIYCH